MNFSDAARKQENLTLTENGAVSLKSTNSNLVDLFATVGAMRQKSDQEIINAFRLAFEEDKLLAIKLLFYSRNIRGGLGERKVFRTILKDLANTNPETVIKNLDIIPVFGRYDDLYELVKTKAESAMWAFLRATIEQDIRLMKEGKTVSMCAKWLKSVNTSSPNSNVLGTMTAKAFGMSERIYRKTLSALRSYVSLPETVMSANEWKKLNYSIVPSRAMKNYRKAFQKHDPIGFATFMAKVEKGEVTIKAGTLYPYDILMSANLNTGSYWNSSHGFSIDNDPVLEAQWKALPNYVKGEHNILIMADTSASMNGLPMATSLSLSIYFAERNKGAYKDLFMTFSESPEFVKLTGSTLAKKVKCIKSIVANTNLEKAFELILRVAINNNISQDEMPKTLIVITDMQFDEATSYSGKTFFNDMKAKFAVSGYAMPSVVFWNVAARGNAFQAEKMDNNVIMVSGHSASTFRDVLGNIGKTPWDFMVETLSNPMYDVIKI